ncbi:MAG: hypothetical protein JXX29_10865 [Deltaproteobacteria bacterium]|nr:hypothetical protein [Deltaproteobacteria bacterium]MBN2672170.1 hypothetical protein [Deltaproteobacteria bacterium]
MKAFFSFAVSVLLVFLAMFGAIGCEPAATDDELKQMCVNLSVVRGEEQVPKSAELTAKVEADFTTKEKNLLAWKAKDMRGWDEELAAKLAKLDGGEEMTGDDGAPATKESLKKLYAKKKDIGAKQFDDDLAKLADAKKNALSEVDGIVKEAQAAQDVKVKECMDAARKEAVSQSLAQCRIAATDKDTFWNKCK